MKHKKAVIVLSCFLLLSLAINAILISGVGWDRQINILPNTEERYIYIAADYDSAMVEAENTGMQEFAKKYGVSVEILAPRQFDTVQQARLLQQAIESKPVGILISAWDTSLTPYINSAVDSGIPVVTVETDLPESKRLAYVGTDWYQLGVRQADALAAMIGESGTVAMLGMVGANSTESAFLGFADAMKKYENIYVLEGYDDMGTVEEAARVTKQLLQDYDMKGIAGFNTNSGIGIAQAVKEAGLQGEVKITCVDMTAAHFKLLKEGLVHKLFGQKRELFTYYGCKLLYDMKNNDLPITQEDDKNGITNIPKKIHTGLIEIDIGNIDAFLK